MLEKGHVPTTRSINRSGAPCQSGRNKPSGEGSSVHCNFRGDYLHGMHQSELSHRHLCSEHYTFSGNKHRWRSEARRGMTRDVFVGNIPRYRIRIVDIGRQTSHTRLLPGFTSLSSLISTSWIITREAGDKTDGDAGT